MLTDTCRFGEFVVSKYRTLRDADIEIAEQLLMIEATWTKLTQQLAFLKSVWDKLNAEHQDLQQRILLVLQSRLEVAMLEVSKIGSAPNKRKAAKYAIYIKESLEKTIRDLKAWAAEFDPTWWLILLMADKATDKTINKTIENGLTDKTRGRSFQAAKHIRDALHTAQPPAGDFYLKEATLNAADRSDIPYSTSQLIVTSSSSSQMTFILDSVDCTAVADVSVFSRNVRDLAVRLKKIEPMTFHLLQCLGVSRTRDQVTRRTTSLHFVFKMPQGLYSPKSLRDLLLSSGSPSLTSRLCLARDLATSVSYIHVLDFVHKNIRPETALVFEDSGSAFGPLFLLGFKTFRTADGKSLRLANTDRIENMYQHPERQGTIPGTDHRMQHDIYSLGVCLLEIGLWTSFVTASATDPSPNIPADSSTPHKTYFTTLALENLPNKMGDKYTNVVINCLTCMDPTNEDFGDESEFEDDFGIRIGVKYIEKVSLFQRDVGLR
ncbi:hypothetical protein BJY00DRAFT_167733 [Aspergillus carlsbadensis]|nr:hypothetical protein BJY00DRAFT_167733 [Aspergillus carlsbadensis]